MEMIQEWTTELRYRPYDKWPKAYVDELTKQVDASIWRFHYHIQPVTGLLNDPNGFSYFNGQWHIFYQAYPFGPVHGLKSWYHLYSDNLIDWKRDGIRLEADSIYDSHGVYSGSALPVGDQLFLAFTGNVRNAQWDRHAYQVGAYMESDFTVKKIDMPLIPDPPQGYTHHFRDPQVIFYEDTYYLIIGAQTDDEKGQVLCYQSDDRINWNLLGALTFTDQEMGYMIECPNLLFVDGQAVLIFCPQGIDKTIFDYQNIYPNTYITAEKFDSKTATLTTPSTLSHIDEGFDVYATQGFQAPDGRALTIGWMGLPELHYPTDQENWAHGLTLVRELHIQDGHLYQRPISETTLLRQEALPVTVKQLQDGLTAENNSYELQLTLPEGERGELVIAANSDHTKGLVIAFDTTRGMISVDRGQMTHVPSPEYGTTRSYQARTKTLHLQLFVDSSMFELFINHGEAVLSGRMFPTKQQRTLALTGSAENVAFWPLRSINE